MMQHILRRSVLRFVCVLMIGSGVVWAEEHSPGRAGRVPQMPMAIAHEHTTNYRWLKKPVLESRLLDDMEDAANWSHQGYGEMVFTKERARDGQRSIRLLSPTLSGKPNPVGRPFGSATVRRRFAGEDWRDYNRLSFWVYPTLPGFRVISMSVILHNEGSVRVPGPYGRDGRNYFLLKPDTWNHVVWEIAHLARDKVTAVEFIYRLQGNEPGATGTVCYDIDHLELQKVDADHYEGWNVAPGRIAFSHTGYSLGASKSAIASGIPAEAFKLVNAETNAVVLTRPIEIVKSPVGTFQVMDFSQVRQPGTYFIEAGDATTPPFRVCENVWRRTVWKTVNFFYCQRCGTEVPGIHGVCHGDWQCVHDNKRITINGGWHDAGDLSQGLVNTAEGTYAMFALAERLHEEDPILAQRLIEEARWGLDWILKTRFGDGYRTTWATMDFWTDGIVGTVDDMTVRARNSPFENLVAASTEALASRVLRNNDPNLASRCLKAAREDWRLAIPRAQSRGAELAAAGVLASVDLFKTTKEESYGKTAIGLAEVILKSQERRFMPWKVPLTGFFYSSPRKDRILHYSHRSHEQAPVVALAELCRAFPGHPDWIQWYSGVVLYSEYLRTISRFTEPYGMMPGSVYQLDESSRPEVRDQVVNGIQIGEGHYLRLFPVWNNGYRGNNGTLLSQAKALSVAAHLRRSLELAELCQRQLQWVVGRNPFVQSTMYGEGYDYAPQYTAMSGDMVGSLAVGIQTHFNNDRPYWPADNCYNFKEVWVHPSARWLWIMRELGAPARVVGHVKPGGSKPVVFREALSGKTTVVKPELESGEFVAPLSEGQYTVLYAGHQRTMRLLPGEIHHLELREHLDFQVEEQTSPDGRVTITLNVEGDGHVRFAIRAYNLTMTPQELETELEAGKRETLRWRGEMTSTKEPWVAVIVPNDNLSQRKEIVGSGIELRDMSIFVTSRSLSQESQEPYGRTPDAQPR